MLITTKLHHTVLAIILLFDSSISTININIQQPIQAVYGTTNDGTPTQSITSPSSPPLFPESQSMSNPSYSCLDYVEQILLTTTCGRCTREKFESSGIFCCNNIRPFYQSKEHRNKQRRIGYCKVVSAAIYPIACSLILLKCPPAGYCLSCHPLAIAHDAIDISVGWFLTMELGGCFLGQVTKCCCTCEDPKYSDDTLFEDLLKNCDDQTRQALLRRKLEADLNVKPNNVMS